MYITISRLVEMGVLPQEIEAKISGSDWKTARPEPIDDAETRILISSLPLELQTKWARANRISSPSPEILGLLAEAENFGLADREARITELLSLLAADERAAWLAEAVRLAKLLDRYDRTIPKRRRNATTGKLEFTAEVVELCQEAVCHEPLILRRQPHRAEVPSPHTLERWLRDYRREGLLAFLHSITKREPEGKDKRCAKVSPAAVTWINGNWRRFHGPRFLYRALEEEAQKQSWRIPSESWLYRIWRQMPEIVKTSHRHGKGTYESKYAPYVPRDYS